MLDYLNGLQWDGKPRLDRWLIIYTGAEDTELNREFGRIALIAAVRRARHPGTKFDPIIVLEGPMGTQQIEGDRDPGRCREFQRSDDLRRARSGAARVARRRLALRDRRADQHPHEPKLSTSRRLRRERMIERGRPMVTSGSTSRGAACCSPRPTMTSTSRKSIGGSGRSRRPRSISKRSA